MELSVLDRTIETARRNGEVAMAQFLTDRLTAFVQANPLTMDATPQPFKRFLAELMTAMTARCRDGA